LAVEERLFAEPVARKVQFFALSIQESDSEHPVEMPERVIETDLRDQVEKYFRVGAPPTGHRSARSPLVNMQQVFRVIDFAIEDNRKTPVEAGHGLLASPAEVADGQPTKSKAGPRQRMDVRSSVVRASMNEGRVGLGKPCVEFAQVSYEAGYAKESAHAGSPGFVRLFP
jgi:hypothetical protein